MHPSDLRVALFSGNYNYVRDGANQALNLLVGHLQSRGVTVRIYSPTTDTPAFPPTGDLVSVPSFPLPGGRGEYRSAVGITARIRDDLAKFAPNIVHVAAPEWLGHRAIRWAEKHNVAAVASLHTRFETYPRYYGMRFLEPLFEKLLTRFYNRFDRVVVPGRGMVELLRGWGVKTPVDIWSRGVNHDRFTPHARSQEWRTSLGIGADEVAIAFLGRLVLEKGLDVFADVILELERRGVPHRVLVIGDGPARDAFAAKVPAAIFAGFQSGDDLGRAVASMDIFFNPSVTESFGNVTLEAMACGVPVVAAHASGAVGLIDDGVTGFLLPPLDISAYADAIEKLIADPARRVAMGAAGHSQADSYRWDTINEAVVTTYLSAIGGVPVKA